ncbi:GNAT family N-acetyltransferase [Arenibacterium halophilum]|uniref:GNAT family N-acetyltransferase n=1 Tax=Arenibacterium halophilum TaxID=2583821 RepID=A0ABY2XE71_9RHOB|nr:GNAT family N-acetyltransferase [Arenibacterium halophilum]TMV15308.1 GNAT family N-acetyltransferase [Arenibacterium halophilum]
MSAALRVLTGAALDGALEDVARLRIAVFCDWPYLYDGDLAYERDYLDRFRSSAGAVVVGAFDGTRLVGAATGAPLSDHAADFAEAFDDSGLNIGNIFYCAESVLLPEWRGQGLGHGFFDHREAHARWLGLSRAAFCSVLRPPDHPLQPSDYQPLDGFWRKRGYAPLPGVIARFRWRDVDQPQETEKSLQFWSRQL